MIKGLIKLHIEYTDDLPRWIGGTYSAPSYLLWFSYFGLGHGVIKIRKKYIDDIGLLEHEKVHYMQYRNNWFHIVKYKWSKEYRLECELEAYQKQIEIYKYTDISQCEWIIDGLHDKYNLGMTRKYIRKRVVELITK